LTEYAPNLFRCFSSFVEIRHVKKLLDPDFKKYEPNTITARDTTTIR